MASMYYAWVAASDPMFPRHTMDVKEKESDEGCDVVEWYEKEIRLSTRHTVGEIIAIKDGVVRVETSRNRHERHSSAPWDDHSRPAQVKASIARIKDFTAHYADPEKSAEDEGFPMDDFDRRVTEVAQRFGAEARADLEYKRSADAVGKPVPREPIARIALWDKPTVIMQEGTVPTNEADKEAMGFPEAELVTQGQGVAVLVIDTGCNVSHPCLGGAVPAVIDCTGHGDGVPDLNGHGTFCMSQIISRMPMSKPFGTARAVRPVAARVLHPRDGWGTDSQIARGVRAGIALKVQVISASIGGSSRMPLTEAAVKDAIAAGIVVVAAAGNSGSQAPDADFPGRIPGVLCVGSVSHTDALSTFSNRGHGVLILARGEAQAGAVGESGYGRWSGTSMATPHVAAACALFMGAFKDIHGYFPTPDQVITAMLKTSRGKGSINPRLNPMCGIVNAGDAIGDIATPDPIDPPPTDPLHLRVPYESDKTVDMMLMALKHAWVSPGHKATVVIEYEPANDD